MSPVRTPTNKTRNRTVFISDQVKPIELEYSDNGTYFGDTVLRRYDDYKISLVLTDDCGAVIGSRVIYPKRGDMIIFRPNEVHFGRFPRLSEYCFISFLFPTDLFDHVCCPSKPILAPFLDDSEQRVNLIRLSGEDKAKLIGIAEELLLMMKEDSDKEYFDAVAFAKLIEALTVCSKCYPQQKLLGDAQLPHPVVAKALRRIDEDFPDFIGLSDLAVHCGCSETYLTQIFRSYTGKTIYGYLTESRLEHARVLLKKGVSVTEAACQSGFYDTSRFITQFRKRFGITPGKYRKALPEVK